MSFQMGSYRFRERLIRPASSLYVPGWFRTIHSNPAAGFISKQVDDLVRQWKLQPERYLREFDFDQNSKIQKAEWKAIRVAARKQVLAKISSEQGEHHVNHAPSGKRPAIHHLGDPGGRPGDAEKAKSLLGSYGRFSGFQYTSSDVFNSCLFIRLIDRRS